MPAVGSFISMQLIARTLVRFPAPPRPQCHTTHTKNLHNARVRAKGELPCRFEGLEELVGLEEGGEGEGVEETVEVDEVERWRAVSHGGGGGGLL